MKLGWAMNFGFLYEKTEQELSKIFSGGADAEVAMRAHHVSYVFIGPVVQEQLHPDERYFTAKFPLLYESPAYRIYNMRTFEG